MNPKNPHGWFIKAERDLHLGQFALSDQENSYPDLICYHCQQAAEKYLKALVMHHGLPLRKTHDLEELLDLLAPLEASITRLFYEEALKINLYGIEIRYSEPEEDPTLEDVIEALQVAGFFRQFAASVLGIAL
ncbi:MAG: HEPN domain-containing protein [Saprospiraceae bacterium]